MESQAAPAIKLTVGRLMAVERAVTGERDLDLGDVLLSSVLVALDDGPKSKEGIVERVRRMWPGAGVRADRINEAAEAAVSAGMAGRSTEDDGTDVFSAMITGPTGDALRRKADDLVAETQAAVATHFRDEYGEEPSRRQIETYTSCLIDAISAGMRNTFEGVYSGRVNEAPGHDLIPDNWDLNAVNVALTESVTEQTSREILQALALSAFDPTNDFGSELVTKLAIGYILHAFVGRLDQAADIDLAGPLVGVSLLIDTPHLITLTESSPSRSKLERILAAARHDAKMNITVPIGCMEEFKNLLLSPRSNEQAEHVGRALAEGRSAYVIRQLSDSGIIRAWMTHWSEGQRPSWEQYRSQALALEGRLADNGFNFRRRPDAGDVNSTFDELCDALHEYLVENPRSRQDPSGPNRDSIRTDGETMTLAYVARSQSDHRFWPGAWILTPDRRLAPAYSRVVGSEPFDVTISPSQLAPLLSTFVPPKQRHQLAEAAANHMSHSTLLRVSTRFPTDIAVEIARRIRGEHDEIDVRVVQQSTPQDVLGELKTTNPERAAIAYADKLTSRRERLAQEMQERAARRVAEAEGAAQAAQEQADRRIAAVEAESSRAVEELRHELDQERSSREATLNAERALETKLEVEWTDKQKTLNDALSRELEERRAAEAEVSHLRAELVEARHTTLVQRRRYGVMAAAMVLLVAGVFFWISTAADWPAVVALAAAPALGVRGYIAADDSAKSWKLPLAALVVGDLVAIASLVAGLRA